MSARVAKENNQYDFSRFNTFQKCPLKHDYIYREHITTDDVVNEHLTPGSMFHRCVELNLLQPTDYRKELASIFAEFNKLCLSGDLPFEAGTLLYIVEKYFEYYNSDFKEEKLLLCEHTFSETVEGTDDTIMGTIDQVYERDEVVTLRDIKTTHNALKYSYEDVKTNQQLLFYVPYAEAEIGVHVDAVEIDEVRIAKLQPVPLLKDGKPTKDKRLLGLVTKEDYEEELKTQGLFGDAAYNNVLEWMELRGHPLFKRTRVQILDGYVVDANLNDMLHTYETIKATPKGYRVRGPLCDYCPYKDLCELDMHNPSDEDREIFIEKITKNP